MRKVLSVLGPTGSGKSELSIKLAEFLGGEIINCDSVQLYKGFDIGTDKVSRKVRKRVPHHLMDIISDCRRFSAAEFAKLAANLIRKISAKGKIPVIVGGTFLYVRALEKGLFPVGGAGDDFREKWKSEVHELRIRTAELDPKYYAKIGSMDARRMVRLMEVFHLSGKNMSESFADTNSPLKGWKFIKIAVKREREELYRRIEERVEEMFRRGIIKEVRKLLSSGCSEECPPFSAIGYKEVLSFVKGKISLEEVKRLMKKNTKEYARKQLMWLRHENNIVWVPPDDIKTIVKLIGKR